MTKHHHDYHSSNNGKCYSVNEVEISRSLWSSFLLSLILELRGTSQLTLMVPPPHLKVGGLLTSRGAGGDGVRTSVPRKLSDFVFGEEAVFDLLCSEAARLLGDI